GLVGAPPLADHARERAGDRLGRRVHEDVPPDRAPDRAGLDGHPHPPLAPPPPRPTSSLSPTREPPASTTGMPFVASTSLPNASGSPGQLVFTMSAPSSAHSRTFRRRYSNPYCCCSSSTVAYVVGNSASAMNGMPSAAH